MPWKQFLVHRDFSCIQTLCCNNININSDKQNPFSFRLNYHAFSFCRDYVRNKFSCLNIVQNIKMLVLHFENIIDHGRNWKFIIYKYHRYYILSFSCLLLPFHIPTFLGKFKLDLVFTMIACKKNFIYYESLYGGCE